MPGCEVVFCTMEQYGNVLVVVLAGAGHTTLVVGLAVACAVALVK